MLTLFDKAPNVAMTQLFNYFDVTQYNLKKKILPKVYFYIFKTNKGILTM